MCFLPLEMKKSNSVDLESRKRTAFLLGLNLALALLLAALEYTAHPSMDADSEDIPDEFAEEMETLKAPDIKDMVAVLEPVASVPAVTEKVTESANASANSVDRINLGIKSDGMAAAQMKLVPEKVEPAEISALPPVVLDEKDKPLNWRVVEELPDFPGGMVMFMKWITQNLKYPPAAKTQKIQGKVIVQFVVNKDGSVSDCKVVGPVHPLLDREALRVLALMPEWKPGTMGGKPCRTLFAMPIVFRL